MSAAIDYLNRDAALLKNHQLIVAMGTPAKAPASPVKKEYFSHSTVSPWGADNDHPQQVIKLAEQSTELAALLDWKARALQGREVIAVEQTWNEQTQAFEEKTIHDEEITLFLNSLMFKHYLREASTDFFWFWNIFPEMIKTAAGDKIAYLGIVDASQCRWSKMDKQGIIKNCYVSANWPHARIEDETMLKFLVVDPYSPTAVEDLRAARHIKKIIYPVSYPSPGKSYYQLAPWDGWRSSSWPELARMIPQTKVELMRHLLSAKFILEIPINYW